MYHFPPDTIQCFMFSKDVNLKKDLHWGKNESSEKAFYLLWSLMAIGSYGGVVNQEAVDGVRLRMQRGVLVMVTH